VEEHNAVRRALALRMEAVPDLDLVGRVATLEEALKLLEKTPVSVILYGIQRGSPERLAKIVGTVHLLAAKGSKVIVLAPYSDELERQALLEAGASCYLLKQINTPKLINEIEQAARAVW